MLKSKVLASTRTSITLDEGNKAATPEVKDERYEDAEADRGCDAQVSAQSGSLQLLGLESSILGLCHRRSNQDHERSIDEGTRVVRQPSTTINTWMTSRLPVQLRAQVDSG